MDGGGSIRTQRSICAFVLVNVHGRTRICSINNGPIIIWNIAWSVLDSLFDIFLKRVDHAFICLFGWSFVLYHGSVSANAESNCCSDTCAHTSSYFIANKYSNSCADTCAHTSSHSIANKYANSCADTAANGNADRYATSTSKSVKNSNSLEISSLLQMSNYIILAAV